MVPGIRPFYEFTSTSYYIRAIPQYFIHPGHATCPELKHSTATHHIQLSNVDFGHLVLSFLCVFTHLFRDDATITLFTYYVNRCYEYF